jgi:putative endonuclease
MATTARSDVWFVYIVRCADGSLYTGIARDIEARLAAHSQGRGARYTRGRGPFTLCAKRRCRSKRLALQVEYAVKQLSRTDKEQLIARGMLARLRVRTDAAKRARATPTPQKSRQTARTTRSAAISTRAATAAGISPRARTRSRQRLD